MYTHTLLGLLVLLTSIPAVIYCYILPDNYHVSAETLTDPRVRFAVKAINEMFANAGDNRERVLERIASTTIQTPSGTIYRYRMGVTGGNTRELCVVNVLSGPRITELQAIQIQEPPQCHSMTLNYVPRSNATCYRRRCDNEFLGALDYLEEEITMLSNSSRYLDFFSHWIYDKKSGLITIYNLSFIKNPCTLAAKMDERRDYWGVCMPEYFTQRKAVECTFVEVIYSNQFQFDPQYKLVNQNCTTTE